MPIGIPYRYLQSPSVTVGLKGFMHFTVFCRGRNKAFMEALDSSEAFCIDVITAPGPLAFYTYCTPRGWQYLKDSRYLSRFCGELFHRLVDRQEKVSEWVSGRKWLRSELNGQLFPILLISVVWYIIGSATRVF